MNNRPIQVVDTSDGAAPERTADGVVVISLYPTHGLQHHSEYHETSKQRASKAEEVPLRSPELESRLPSCPPDPVSQQFLLFMDWNRLYNRESHFRVLHSAVKLLKRTYSNGKHLFALDHCKISQTRFEYDILPPNDPFEFDDFLFANIIKVSNIEFILNTISMSLPLVECSQLTKQYLEDIIDEWNQSGIAFGYLRILDELDQAFQNF